MKAPMKKFQELVRRTRSKVSKGSQDFAYESPKKVAKPPSPPQDLASKNSPPDPAKQHADAPPPPRYSGSVREWVTGSGTLYKIHGPATNIAVITAAICTAACAVPTPKVELVAEYAAKAIARIAEYLATVPSQNTRDIAVELMKHMNKCIDAFRSRHVSLVTGERWREMQELWKIYRDSISTLGMSLAHNAFYYRQRSAGCLRECLLDIDKSTEAASIEAAPVIAQAIQTAMNKVAEGISLAPNHHREALAKKYTSYTRQIANGIAGGIKVMDKTIV